MPDIGAAPGDGRALGGDAGGLEARCKIGLGSDGGGGRGEADMGEELAEPGRCGDLFTQGVGFGVADDAAVADLG